MQRFSNPPRLNYVAQALIAGAILGIHDQPGFKTRLPGNFLQVVVIGFEVAVGVVEGRQHQRRHGKIMGTLTGFAEPSQIVRWISWLRVHAEQASLARLRPPGILYVRGPAPTRHNNRIETDTLWHPAAPLCKIDFRGARDAGLLSRQQGLFRIA